MNVNVYFRLSFFLQLVRSLMRNFNSQKYRPQSLQKNSRSTYLHSEKWRRSFSHIFFKQSSFWNLIVFYLIPVKICPKGVSKRLITIVQTIVSSTFEKLNIRSNDTDTVEVVVFSCCCLECVPNVTNVMFVSL
jgi:hypothetical protein